MLHLKTAETSLGGYLEKEPERKNRYRIGRQIIRGNFRAEKGQDEIAPGMLMDGEGVCAKFANATLIEFGSPR